MLKRHQVVEYAKKHMTYYDNCGTCKHAGKALICYECHRGSRYVFDWKEVAKNLVLEICDKYNHTDLTALGMIKDNELYTLEQKGEVIELMELNYKVLTNPDAFDEKYEKRMHKLLSSYGIEVVDGKAQLKEGAYA